LSLILNKKYFVKLIFYKLKKEPEFTVNNVVCAYSTRCHLNLRKIAKEGMHVEYRKENGVIFLFFYN
jgi:TATA-box binding protein (TBP) (component of TFIID and TFIIIB)